MKTHRILSTWRYMVSLKLKETNLKANSISSTEHFLEKKG